MPRIVSAYLFRDWRHSVRVASPQTEIVVVAVTLVRLSSVNQTFGGCHGRVLRIIHKYYNRFFIIVIIIFFCRLKGTDMSRLVSLKLLLRLIVITMKVKLRTAKFINVCEFCVNLLCIEKDPTKMAIM